MAEDIKDTSPEATEASLMALLTGAGESDDEEQQESEDQDEQNASGDEGESDEQEGEGSESGEEGESEEQEEQEGEEDAEEWKPENVPDDAVIYTIERDGKQVPVTKGEARQGTMFQADYSRKTAEVAEERKTLQAERTELKTALDQVLAAMDGADAEATPEKLALLARDNPEEAMRLRFEREARDEQRKKITKAQEELTARTVKERLAAAQVKQKEEYAKLQEALPVFKDEAKAKVALAEMTKAAVAVGYSEADMNGIGDHRLMRLLDLAAIGLRLSSKKPPTPAPKGTKIPVILPGAKKVGNGVTRTQRELGDRAKATRSADDAAAALLADMEAAARSRRVS